MEGELLGRSSLECGGGAVQVWGLFHEAERCSAIHCLQVDILAENVLPGNRERLSLASRPLLLLNNATFVFLASWCVQILNIAPRVQEAGHNLFVTEQLLIPNVYTSEVVSNYF